MGPQLQLTSTAFSDGGAVPEKYTCAAGFNNMTSPALQWTNAPKDTASFVLLLHDPEPRPRKGLEDVTHWLVYNIPGDATGLPEGVKPDAPASVGVQGKNIMGSPSYMGPCAPPGPNHHYTFELFALDAKLDLPAGATRADVMKAMDGHILGAAVYIGLFHRQAGGMTPPPPPPAR
jgi:Raf kinase inhibitor-like YbhB/YbcL family protein